MRASRSRTRDATNLLTSTPDEFALGLARFLLTAKDLLSLCLAWPRFAAKVIAAGGAAAVPGAAPELLSMVEEVARLWVAGCSEQQRGWALRRGLESWLGLMHEVERLRVPLVFGRAHAEVTLSQGGAVATRTAGGDWQAAASKVVMRSGRHFAQLTVEQDVIRPGWDVQGGLNRRFSTATASATRTSGAATPAGTTGRGGSPRRNRATASACSSTSTRAA